MSLFFVEKDAVPTPFRAGFFAFSPPISSPFAPHSAGSTNNNQWFIEEGGELLASETKGMLMDFIRGAHAVCNLSLCGIFLMILDFIRGVHAVCNLSLCGIFLMILDFIRGVHAVDLRRQNDLRHIIV